jgi:lantibiotic modifying enzyme
MRSLFDLLKVRNIPSISQGPVVDAVMAAGRAGATLTSSPLMYTWKGTRYLGASHGLAGILHILMHFPLNKADHDDVKGALKYLLRTRYFRGNYPSKEHNTRGDQFVHWCHGAPGVAITLCKAAEVYHYTNKIHSHRNLSSGSGGKKMMF